MTWENDNEYVQASGYYSATTGIYNSKAVTQAKLKYDKPQGKLLS